MTSSSKKTRRTNITKTNLEKNKKTLERLKVKLKVLLNQRDNMSSRYKLLISAKQKTAKRPIDAKGRVDADYKYLTNRINSVKAEILSLEGGVITKEVLPWVKGEQPKRGGFGRNFGLKSSYTVNGKTYQYKEGDLYFNDKIGDGELALIKSSPNLPPEGGGEFNLGDTAEGGEMSPEHESRALSSTFYQQLQIKNNESKLNKTYTNGTF
tara:strand:- start:160 stop:789 length:630 start_codon:yes stop_codon:yes gene_type:complete